MTVSCVNIIHI